MSTKRIPYAQALKLAQWLGIFQATNPMAQSMLRQVDQMRQKLVDAGEFTDIPLDGQGLDIKLEAGPDKHGLIEVEWTDEPAN